MTFRNMRPLRKLNWIIQPLSRLSRRTLYAGAFALIFAIAGVLYLFFSYADTGAGTIYRMVDANGHHYLTANYSAVQYFSSCAGCTWRLEAAYPNSYEQGQPATPVYHLYNVYNNDNFYTTSYAEAQNAYNVYGYNYIPIEVAWYTYNGGQPPPGYCRQSWYRLDNASYGHYYTPSVQEAYGAQLFGYTLESTSAFTTDEPCFDATSIGTTLTANQTLYAGQSMLSTGQSSNGSGYTLIMQGDGNLVVYNNATARPTWQTGATGANNHLIMQSDGNLVIYNGSGGAVWSTGTPGRGSNDVLIMQPDGNLVIYNGPTAVWSIWTGVIAPPPPPPPPPASTIQLSSDITSPNPAWSSSYTPITAYNTGPNNTQYCLDGTKSIKNGAIVQQWNCYNPKQQQWALVASATPGYYNIKSLYSGNCLDGTTLIKNGVKVQQWNCYNPSQQRWKIIPSNTAGFYKLLNEKSNKCLDASSTIGNGVQVQEWNCWNTSAQLWGGAAIAAAYTHRSGLNTVSTTGFNGPNIGPGPLVGCTSATVGGCSSGGTWWEQGGNDASGYANYIYPVTINPDKSVSVSSTPIGEYVDDYTWCPASLNGAPGTTQQSYTDSTGAVISYWIGPPCINYAIDQVYANASDPKTYIYAGLQPGWGPSIPLDHGAVGLYQYYPYGYGTPGYAPPTCGNAGYIVQRYFGGDTGVTPDESHFEQMWNAGATCPGGPHTVAWH